MSKWRIFGLTPLFKKVFLTHKADCCTRRADLGVTKNIAMTRKTRAERGASGCCCGMEESCGSRWWCGEEDQATVVPRVFLMKVRNGSEQRVGAAL